MNRIFPSLLLPILVVLPILSAFSSPLTAHAATFDPNFILSDDQLTDYDSMSKREIQDFLDDQDGFLATYETENYEGEEMLASEIIYNASQEIGINPKFLIVLLQKEQSLITDDEPNDRQLDWATGYAVCDDCSKDDPAIQRWKGFGKQVNSASLQFIEGYLEDVRKYGVTSGNFGPDIEVTISGELVTPENATTAGMYAYTPHIHGNSLFDSIWKSWFGNTATDDLDEVKIVRHVSGTLLKATDSPDIYLIDNGSKRLITSWTAFISRFNEKLIIEVDASVLEKYELGREVKLANYSLIRDESDNYYLLVDDLLRPFESKDAFRKIGFVEDELVDVEDAEVTQFALGEEITATTSHPTGQILRLETGLTFVVKDGYRQVVLDDTVLRSRFPNLTILSATPDEVSQYPETSPVLLPNGYLVKSPESADVFVISDSERLSVPSEEVFHSHGFQFKNVIVIDEVSLKMHKLGGDLQLLTD